MGLTTEQLKAVQGGESLRLNEKGTDLIVLRADLFERLRGLVYDNSPWTDEEMDLLAQEDVDALGWEGMEGYQGADS